MEAKIVLLKDLLQKINDILIKENVFQHEKTKRGENFNVFKTLGLATDEVRLHSSFLAELLNSRGTHGLANKYLDAFMQIVIKDKDFEFDSTNATVEVEKVIGYKTESEGGRIDIVITDRNENAIIIENKINAGDQECQLLRYHNWGKNKKSHKLVYLTKEGNEPSETSTKKKCFDYVCISYRDDILRWLERCMELSFEHPLVRETIKQYIINLKEILNIMSDSSQTELINIAIDKAYIESTLSMYENMGVIAKQIRRLFVMQLQEIAKEYNLICNNKDEIEEFSADRWIYFYKENSSWAICIGAYRIGDGYLYGIVPWCEGGRIANDLLASIKSKFGKVFEEIDANEEFPLGSCYLYGNDDIWWRWDNVNTLRDMYNGKIAKFLKENLFEKVIKEEWFEKLEKLESEVREKYNA